MGKASLYWYSEDADKNGHLWNVEFLEKGFLYHRMDNNSL